MVKRKRYTIVFCLCSFLVVNARAQLFWDRVDSLFGKLPPSIKIFRTTDSLNGRPFIAYFLEASLKDRSLEFTAETGKGKRFTPNQYYLLEDSPIVILNGGFFSFTTNQNLSLVMRDGIMEACNTPALKSKFSDSFYYPTRGAFGITKGRRPDVAWTFTDSAQLWPYAFQYEPIVAKGKTSDPSFIDLRTLDSWKWWKMNTAIGGGPVLVKNGIPYVTNKEEQLFVDSSDARHPRTAIGYTRKRKLIILVIQGRFPGLAEGATLEEEAKILVNLQCIEALNLDGGGSSCLLLNGKETIRPSDKEGQRAVPSVFIIRKREKL